MSEQNNQEPKTHPKGSIHRVLARSYSTYFVFLLLGIILDSIFPIRMLPASCQIIGMVIIFLGTLLILWSQQTSARLDKKKKSGVQISESDFHKGPYRFSRSPTHTGLNLLFIGFGFLFNSILIIIMTTIPLLIARFVFLQKMEKILEDKYDSLYKNYKQKVKTKI